MDQETREILEGIRNGDFVVDDNGFVYDGEWYDPEAQPFNPETGEGENEPMGWLDPDSGMFHRDPQMGLDTDRKKGRIVTDPEGDATAVRVPQGDWGDAADRRADDPQAIIRNTPNIDDLAMRGEPTDLYDSYKRAFGDGMEMYGRAQQQVPGMSMLPPTGLMVLYQMMKNAQGQY